MPPGELLLLLLLTAAAAAAAAALAIVGVIFKIFRQKFEAIHY